MIPRPRMAFVVTAIAGMAFSSPHPSLLAADLDDLRTEGLITTTTADSITIVDSQSGTEQTFVVNAATRITRYGKPTMLRNVLPGEFARISARRINERRMAATIFIRTP
jgi:hypothetical protein